MSAPAKVSTLPEVPAEVLSFAAEMGVGDYLYPVLEMTARLFAGCPLKIVVAYDAEDPDWEFILIGAKIDDWIDDWSAERIVAALGRWSQELVDHCPNSHTRYFVCSIA